MSDADDEDGKATSLLQAPADDAQVIRVDYKEEGKASLYVTQKAKISMSYSMDAMANQPTIFYKMDYVMQAVADACDKDKLEMSFPQTPELLGDFNWDTVLIGRTETHFSGTTPEKEICKQVRAVHKAVKDEKDEEARARGLPKSGVQAWTTYAQRWREWRDLCAVYRSMYPDETKQMVCDQIKSQCKMLTSIDKIYTDAVAIEVKKHIDKMKRDDRKRIASEKLQAELDKTEADKVKAATQREQADAEAKRLKQEKEALKMVPRQGNKKQKARARKLEEKEKNDQIKAAKQAKTKADKVAKDKEKQANAIKRQQRAFEDLASAPSPKKPKFR